MENLKAKIILEIIGRPPEHIKEALENLILKLSDEKNVSVINKVINEPKQVENTDNLWTAFAEIEAEFESLDRFFDICMSYMPSHVEVFDPQRFKFDADRINILSNFLINKLHNYDAIAKRLLAENKILVQEVEKLKQGGMNITLGKREEDKKIKTNKMKDKSSKKKSSKK